MLLLSLLLLVTTVLADYTPPRYRIQLDHPPSTRWNEVVDAHMQYLPLFKQNAESHGDADENAAKDIADNIRKYFPVEYAQELEGIAVRANVSLADLVANIIYYDVMAYNRHHTLFLGCTSIVGCDDKGRIWHGRNLDFVGGTLLDPTTVLVDFYRGKKLLYTGITAFPNVGLLTGQKASAFSISLNARYSGNYSQNVEMINEIHYKNLTLEEEHSFPDVVQRLTFTPLICPAYFIVGGVKPFEGAVISRERQQAYDVQILSEERWFIAQSNVDHWTDDVDMRSIDATSILTKMGRAGLNATSMFGVMSTPPIRNNLTIFSTVMSAAIPSTIYETTVIVEY